MSNGAFWPNSEHWSVKIPLQTPHPRMSVLAETGFVMLKPMPVAVPAREWESLEYMDWKSGGDTNFAPLASADGQLDCRGFWDKGKTDKDALWTSNADKAPTLRDYVFASSNSNRRIARPRFVRYIATTTTASTPMTRDGWCARGSSSPTLPTVTCC
jgi:hypothetical protein